MGALLREGIPRKRMSTFGHYPSRDDDNAGCNDNFDSNDGNTDDNFDKNDQIHTNAMTVE